MLSACSIFQQRYPPLNKQLNIMGIDKIYLGTFNLVKGLLKFVLQIKQKS